MYACGPTVYNYFHIGNARCFVLFDMLRRYLEYRGNKVKFVQNFTDIDDKMIQRATEEGTSVKEVANKYIRAYFADAKGLGIKPATVHPCATENIDAIIAIIETLQAKGHAYVAGNDVYFSTRSFKKYGKLSKIDVDDLESGARIDINDVKKDPIDFALWKGWKEGEPAWDSPWGRGRPGWHIECSAMVDKYLGKTIDIHCGGADLAFPHHENEVAQSEAAFGVPFARFWLHNGYINVDNQKMSKSAGNFFTVREASAQYSYPAIRYFLLSAHYRSPVNFSADSLEQAQAALDRLYRCEENLSFALKNASSEGAEDAEGLIKCMGAREKFVLAMEDDFNTADAMGVVFELVRDINTFLRETRKEKDLRQVHALYMELISLMGFEKPAERGKIAEEEIEELIALRGLAKKEKNYALADEIRNNLKEKGVVLEDTAHGVKWRYEN